MGYVRFALAKKHRGREARFFEFARALRDDSEVDTHDRSVLTEALAWFGERLLTPARFNRTRSKGYYLRSTRGICWFRDTASEHIAQMHRIVAILEAYGHPVTIIRESRVGYLVYEDEFQVVAEPFADTRTGASR